MPLPPDEPTDEERQQELPEDHGTPFSAPDVGPANTDRLNDTHPATDSGLQPEEIYEEGVAGAAEANEPVSDTGVAGYSPPDEQDSNGEDKDKIT